MAFFLFADGGSRGKPVLVGNKEVRHGFRQKFPPPNATKGGRRSQKTTPQSRF